ncbi:unnamed protein product, partial [Symbiodinium necroappetens]
MSLLVNVLSRHSDLSSIPPRGTRRADMGLWRTRDGKFICTTDMEPRYWAIFCETVGRPDFVALQNDVESRPEIRSALEAIFRERDLDEWLAILGAAGTQFAPVHSIGEALEDPHNKARGMALSYQGAGGRTVRQIGQPVRFGQESPVRWLGRAPGADTEALLEDIGLSKAEIETLRTTGALGEFQLTYSTSYSPTHPYGAADEQWIERIQDQTDGRVAITPFWGGSLITSREGVDELAAGVADIAFIAPIYASSGYDLSRLTPQFFYGYEDAQDVLGVYLDLWEEYPQFAEELDGVKVLGFNAGTPMHLMLREQPFEELADLQGLRIRSAVDYVGALANFGAEGVTMPMAETYPSLQRGVLDGVI